METILTESAADKEGLSGERMTTYKTAEARFDALTGDLEARVRADEIAADMAKPQEVTLPATTTGATPSAEGGTDERAAAAVVENRAFWQYVRKGAAGVNAEDRSALLSAERRDLSDITGASGGFTVPQGFLAKITERMKYYGPMRLVANVIQTSSGQDMPWPNNDDTAVVAAVLTENVAIANADIAFTQKTLKSFVWTSGLVRVPNTLLNDSAFDIESFLTKKFGQRFGRGQNTAFTAGAGHGSNTAQGIVGNLSSTVVTTATAGGLLLTYGDLINTFHGVDPAYRNSNTAGWMLSDGALKAARLITDTTNRPIFIPAGAYGGIADQNQPDSLLGKPLKINNDLQPMGSNKLGVGIFGDLEAAYVIRDVLDMQTVRLTERYADFLQTGFFAFARTDGMVDDGWAAVQLNTNT
jgi:HK97 family phage major capsid protein